MTVRLAALPLIASLVLPIGGQSPARDDPAALAAALQRRYARVHDFSARFVHEYAGGALRLRATETGHVLIKKPGRMRWRYESPERKLFVSDGRTIYSYFPEDAQVTVSAMPVADDANAAILLLTGKGNLTRDFRPSLVTLPDLPANSVALQFHPLAPAPEYESLIFVVDREDLTLRQFISTDWQGGTSTFRFTDFQENVGVSDSEFIFTIPDGTEVIRHDADPD